MLLDVALGLRRLGADRTVTGAVLLISSLATGLSAAVAAAVHRVSLAPLDYPHAARLVRIAGVAAGGGAETNVSPPDFRELRRRVRTLDAIAAVSPFAPQLTRTDGPEPEMVTARLITAGYFAALGVPVTGREFTETEETPPARPLVVGERWWRTRLAARPDAVGATLMLNGLAYQVVGIAPDREGVFGRPDVWLPMQFPSEEIRALRIAAVVGRVRATSSHAEVSGEIDAIGRDLQQRFPRTNGQWKPAVAPLSESVAGPARPAARLMIVLVCLLWVATAVSLGGLALARGVAARRERAVRLAIGATPWHLARTALVEQALLAGATVAGAAAVAFWAQGALHRLGLVRATDTPSTVVTVASVCGLVLFTMLLSTAASLSVRVRPDQLGGRSSSPGGPDARRRVAVAVQIVLSIAVLSFAGAVAARTWGLRTVALGYDPSGAQHLRLQLPPRYASPDQREVFWRQVLERIGTVPGVDAAALTSDLPSTGQDNPTAFRALTSDGTDAATQIRSVSDGYFALGGMRLQRGRVTSATDTSTAAKVVVINEELRRRAFANREPLGQTLDFNFTAPPFRAVVIGVVNDVRHGGPALPPQPEAYFPVAQAPLPAYTLAIRSRLAAASLRAAVAAVVHGLDRDVAVPIPISWEASVADRHAIHRWRAGASLAVAALVVLLGAMGLYAAAAHAAAARRREFSLRLALGASARQIRHLLLRDALVLMLAGGLLGGCAGYLLVRLAASQLEGIGPVALPASALATVVVWLTLLLAGSGPARAVSRLDPSTVLRD